MAEESLQGSGEWAAAREPVFTASPAKSYCVSRSAPNRIQPLRTAFPNPISATPHAAFFSDEARHSLIGITTYRVCVNPGA